MAPMIVLQAFTVYLVLRHAGDDDIMENRVRRVMTNDIRHTFTFIAMVSITDIAVSILQLILYNSLLDSGSAVGWVILSSLKNGLYALQVASLAGMLCNSEFSEQGFLILRESAVIELKPGTSEKAMMRKFESSSVSASNSKAEACEYVEVKLTLSQELMWVRNNQNLKI